MELRVATEAEREAEWDEALGAGALADIATRYRRGETPGRIAGIYGWRGQAGAQKVRNLLRQEGVALRHPGPVGAIPTVAAPTAPVTAEPPAAKPTAAEPSLLELAEGLPGREQLLKHLERTQAGAEQLIDRLQQLAGAVTRRWGHTAWKQSARQYYDAQCDLDEWLIALDYLMDDWEAVLLAPPADAAA